MWTNVRLFPGPQQIPEHPDQTDSHQHHYEHLWLRVIQAIWVESLSSHQSCSQQEHVHTQHARYQRLSAGSPNRIPLILTILIFWFITGGSSRCVREGVQLCGSTVSVHLSLFGFLSVSLTPLSSFFSGSMVFCQGLALKLKCCSSACEGLCLESSGNPLCLPFHLCCRCGQIPLP